MSTSPATLDKSTLQPIAASGGASSGPVTLDKSTLAPINPTSEFEAGQEEAKQLVESGAGPAAAYMKPKRTAAALGGMLAAGGTAGAVAGLTAPTLAGTETAGTGILDALGNEITKDVATYGPSAARAALSNPVVQKVLWHIAGSAAAGAGVGGTFALLKKLGVF